MSAEFDPWPLSLCCNASFMAPATEAIWLDPDGWVVAVGCSRCYRYFRVSEVRAEYKSTITSAIRSGAWAFTERWLSRPLQKQQVRALAAWMQPF